MSKTKKQKLPAKEWLQYFEEAGVLADALNECKSKHSRSIMIGKFLSPMVGRTVDVQVGERTGKATLRVEETKHAKSKVYHFEVAWDDTQPSEGKEKAGKSARTKAKKTKEKAKKSGVKKQAASKAGKTPGEVMGKAGKTPATSAGKKRSKKSEGNREEWE